MCETSHGVNDMQKEVFGLFVKPLSRYCSFQRGYGHWDELAAKYYYKRPEVEREIAPAKLPLLTVPNVKDARIRCGFRGSEVGKLLDVLLMDVYSTDKSWMEQWLQRDRSKTSLVRHGDEFRVDSVSGLDNTVTYYLPSPWLAEAECEILEISDESKQTLNQGADQCHLYVEKQTFPEPIWPSFMVVPRSGTASHFVDSTDSSSVSSLHGHEIDPVAAFDVSLQFAKDKSLVSKYLECLDSTNILNISKQLKIRLQGKEQIFCDLERAVLREIFKEDNSVEKYEKLKNSKASVNGTIEEWSREAHKELQTSIEPLLSDFASKQLSLWKVYTYSESKLSLKLHELCNITNDLQMVQNLSHIYGSLDIPQDKLSIIDPDYARNKVPVLHKEINKAVYLNFLQLQFPLIAVSIGGFVTELCTAYSMGALSSLGIVLGLKRVKDTWYSMLKQFQLQIREECRIGIESNKQLLLHNWEISYAEREADLKGKVALLKEIADDLT